MARVKIEFDDKEFQKDMDALGRYMKNILPTELYTEYVYNTPIEGGNARKKTKLVTKKDRAIIDPNYAYNDVLDKGLYPNPPKKGTGKTKGGYSKQAPKGMSKPTIEKAEELVDKFVRSLN